MHYNKFLETKRKSFLESGFEINESELNTNLFDFQKFTVKTALSKGRFAIFADCGLGKTLMQLAWADAVYKHTGKHVLILAPLAVVEQTKDEAVKFGIDTNCFYITNYDQLKNIENINHQQQPWPSPSRKSNAKPFTSHLTPIRSTKNSAPRNSPFRKQSLFKTKPHSAADANADADETSPTLVPPSKPVPSKYSLPLAESKQESQAMETKTDPEQDPPIPRMVVHPPSLPPVVSPPPIANMNRYLEKDQQQHEKLHFEEMFNYDGESVVKLHDPPHPTHKNETKEKNANDANLATQLAALVHANCPCCNWPERLKYKGLLVHLKRWHPNWKSVQATWLGELQHC